MNIKPITSKEQRVIAYANKKPVQNIQEHNTTKKNLGLILEGNEIDSKILYAFLSRAFPHLQIKTLNRESKTTPYQFITENINQVAFLIANLDTMIQSQTDAHLTTKVRNKHPNYPVIWTGSYDLSDKIKHGTLTVKEAMLTYHTSAYFIKPINHPALIQEIEKHFFD